MFCGKIILIVSNLKVMSGERREMSVSIVKSPAPKTRDMTTGDPIRQILAFAVPLFIGNIFQEIYTMVDTMEMGYFVGDSAIAAIGATSSLYSLLMSLVISTNNGYAIVVTQAFGAHDEEKLRRAVAGTIILNVGMTVLVTALSLLFMRPLLHFMNTPENIFEQSYIYMVILCAGMFTTAGYNMFASILRAVGNSRTPLYVLVASSLVNIALDLFLIIVLKLGVVGTALGTVMAQGLSTLLCGRALLRNHREIMPKTGDFLASKPMWTQLLGSGCAMAMMFCVVQLGSLIFQRANNILGETIIAAYTAARKIIVAFMQPLITIATANSTFVSQNWGAKQYSRIRRTLKKVIGLEVAWGVIACAVVYLIDEPLFCLITGTQDDNMIYNGVLASQISLPFFPLLGILLCLRTAMQSMGYKAAPVASSCIELLMKVMGASLLIPIWGYMGTCFTEPLSWVVMTIFLVLAYLIQRKKIFPIEE